MPACKRMSEEGAHTSTPFCCLRCVRCSARRRITGMRVRAFRAVAQDIEGDCARLLGTGLFARVRPRTQLPIGTQGPGYIRDRDGHLNPVVPLNQARTCCPTHHRRLALSLEVLIAVCTTVTDMRNTQIHCCPFFQTITQNNAGRRCIQDQDDPCSGLHGLHEQMLKRFGYLLQRLSMRTAAVCVCRWSLRWQSASCRRLSHSRYAWTPALARVFRCLRRTRR